MNIFPYLLLFLFSVRNAYCADLSGTWVMTKWEENNTTLQGVKYLELSFDLNGKIKSYVLMDEKFGYIQFIGSGIYKINGNIIEWKHGNNSGSSTIKFENEVLFIDPDILLRANGGKIPGKGTYIKRVTPQQGDVSEPALPAR